MFDHIDYVMIMVSDMARSVKFYKDKLGITLKSESAEWTEFETGTTVLALHGGGKPGALQRNLLRARPRSVSTCLTLKKSITN